MLALKLAALLALATRARAAVCGTFPEYEDMPIEHATRFNLTWARDANGGQFAKIDTAAFGTPVSYILTKCASTSHFATSHPGTNVFTVPVRGLFLQDTVQVALLDELGAVDALRAYADTQYISSAAVRRHIRENNVVDVVMTTSPFYGTDYALLATLPGIGAYVVNTYGHASTVTQLNASGLDGKVLLIDELSEGTPLGRAEWIKVMGLVTGKEARTKFTQIVVLYESAKASAMAQSTPTVWWGGWYLDTWYPPVDNSFVAALLRDANAQPITSAPLPFADGLALAKTAEYWLANGNGWGALVDAMRDQPAIADFASVRADKVWDNDASVADTSSANDWFESAIVRPDRALRELAAITHPELAVLVDEFRYFRQVKAADAVDSSDDDDDDDDGKGSTSTGERAPPAKVDDAAGRPILTGLSLGLTVGIVVLGAVLIALVVGLFYVRGRSLGAGAKVELTALAITA